MENEGFIKAYRSLFKSSMWLSEKFTRGQAWLDLIYLCNWKEGQVRKRGIKLKVDRGECGWSIANLAERWMWSKGKVIRFLDELADESRIEQRKNNVSALIKVINYERYQGKRDADDTANGTQTGSQTERKQVRKQVRIEESKEIKKEKIIKEKFHDFVFLTEIEHRTLNEKYGKTRTDEFIARLNNYIGSKGTKYKSHYHTILNWINKDQPVKTTNIRNLNDL